MASEIETDRKKFIPVSPCNLSEKYAGLFEGEEVTIIQNIIGHNMGR